MTNRRLGAACSGLDANDPRALPIPRAGCPGLACLAPSGQENKSATPKRASDGNGSRRAGLPTCPRNRLNRQVYPVLHMSFRAPACEKWRPSGDLAGQTLHEPAASHERKVSQAGVLQSTAVRPEHGKMAV